MLAGVLKKAAVRNCIQLKLRTCLYFWNDTFFS